jgi:isoquinoline 1-oxidoreductase subunit beta
MKGNPVMNTRRQFLQTSAALTGTTLLAFHIPALAQSTGFNAASKGSEVNAWVVVNSDDSVVIRIARSEMGQGTLTGLAQLVAEELECDWSKLSTEYPPPGASLARDRVWRNYSTGGSRGIRESQEYVRQGGAAARMMLIQAAATEWNVPVAECIAANSAVTHTPSGKKLGYGKLAVAASKLTPPATVALKDPKTWKLVGKPVKRLDTADKTNGKLVYGMDLQMPGMLNAAIRQCPVFGGTVKSFNANAIAGKPGVKKVVQVGNSAVAVIADTWWRAKTALDALPIEWDNGANANASSEGFRKVLLEALDAPEAVAANKVGDAKAALMTAARVIEATYSYPHQNHATMESQNATARWTAERCEVWTPTQNGEGALAVAAEAAGLKPAQCEVYKTHLGGGFGRRGNVHDWVRQAVTIAKEMPGVPVKLIWTREEDMQHGLYHPVTACKLKAGLDDKGNIESLHMRIAGQSILSGVLPQLVKDGLDPVVFQGLNPGGAESAIGYTIANVLVDHAMRNPSTPPGFWRGVNLNQNAIYLECFLDEIAAATKQDPLAMRRKMMANHPKHLGVLNAVAEKVGWDKPAAPGVFRGICQTHGFGSYVAACAEVSVSDAGALTIHRIVAATDCGYAVNPQQIEAQVEGSFVYGLTAMMYGECTVKNGRIEQSNFNDYPMMKLAQMPKVETVILQSGGFWGGVGEPTIAVAAPAVLNAIYAATGKRIRDLPLAKHNLKKA